MVIKGEFWRTKERGNREVGVFFGVSFLFKKKNRKSWRYL